MIKLIMKTKSIEYCHFKKNMNEVQSRIKVHFVMLCCTTQKTKFLIKDFLSKYDQIP